MVEESKGLHTTHSLNQLLATSSSSFPTSPSSKSPTFSFSFVLYMCQYALYMVASLAFCAGSVCLFSSMQAVGTSARLYTFGSAIFCVTDVMEYCNFFFYDFMLVNYAVDNSDEQKNNPCKYKLFSSYNATTNTATKKHYEIFTTNKAVHWPYILAIVGSSLYLLGSCLFLPIFAQFLWSLVAFMFASFFVIFAQYGKVSYIQGETSQIRCCNDSDSIIHTISQDDLPTIQCNITTSISGSNSNSNNPHQRLHAIADNDTHQNEIEQPLLSNVQSQMLEMNKVDITRTIVDYSIVLGALSFLIGSIVFLPMVVKSGSVVNDIAAAFFTLGSFMYLLSGIVMCFQ